MNESIIREAPLVYLVMLNFNGRDHLEYSLPSVMNTVYENYRLIVVDNASADDSVAHIQRNYQKVQLIVNQKNRGWAGGNNDGIKYAIAKGAKYIVLINNDILIHPDWITNAVTVAEKTPNVGAIGFRGLSLHRERKELEEAIVLSPPLTFEEADFITGWALFVRATTFKHLGLIDEGYGSFGEEVDFERRLRMAGYRMVRLNTPLCHYSGGSFSKYPVKAAYLTIRNSIRMELKFADIGAAFRRMKSIVNRIRAGRVDLPLDRGFFYANIFVPKTRVFSLLILGYSVLWNLLNLPVTLIAGARDYRRAIQARELVGTE